MIQVTVDRYKGYSVEGHANYAEYGKDIVCASVSVLSQTVLMQLQEVAPVQYRVQGSLLQVKILGDETREVITLLDLLASGISEITEQYPEYVKLEFIKSEEE